MQPYKEISLYEWNEDETELVLDETKYNITDATFLDGTRYLMAVSEDYSQMKIFKQLYVNDLESCANNEYESGFTGRFVNISNHSYMDDDAVEQTVRYYPFNKCCDDKFTTAARGKGKKKQSGDA
jgi:hypothetical protein